MHRGVVKLVVTGILLVLLTPSYAAAMLLFYAPDEMITKSNLITIATVTRRTVQGNSLTGEFRIRRVLIGDFNGKTIKILQRTDRFPEVVQDIPEPGTEVFLLLSKDNTGQYGFTHLNSIGIVDDGKVISIYNGINDDKQPYVPVYNCFIEGMDRIESESARELTASATSFISQEGVTKKPREFKLIYTEVFIPAVVLILLIGLWRNRSGERR